MAGSRRFGLLNMNKPAGLHVAPRRRSGRQARAAGKGGPRRNARSAGDGRAGGLRRQGDAADRTGPAANQIVRGRVSPGPPKRHRRRHGKRDRGRRARAKSRTTRSRRPCRHFAGGFSRSRRAFPPFMSTGTAPTTWPARDKRSSSLRGRSTSIAWSSMRFAYPEIELAIDCGSGTYVRSIGRDLGRALGCGAVMSALVRTRIGPYRIEDAVSPEQLTSETIDRLLLSPTTAVEALPKYVASEEDVVQIRAGRPFGSLSPTKEPPRRRTERRLRSWTATGNCCVLPSSTPRMHGCCLAAYSLIKTRGLASEPMEDTRLVATGRSRCDACQAGSADRGGASRLGDRLQRRIV